MSEPTLTHTQDNTRQLALPSGRKLQLDRPLVMAVVNITPDSFSDGGRAFAAGDAQEMASRLISEGADIIDLGGESTRPGAEPISAEEEQRRVIPVIESIRRGYDIPISIDTYRASAARAALDAGADIVNDISALRFDNKMVKLVRESTVPVILMHMLGKPMDMQEKPVYNDCVSEIADFFSERIEFCERNGIDRARLILDPGIGFGKRLSDNLEILARLDILEQFGLPLLVGASRKSFIDMVSPADTPADQRLGGSIAAAVTAVMHGADIVRVHDVRQTVEALAVARAIQDVV